MVQSEVPQLSMQGSAATVPRLAARSHDLVGVLFEQLADPPIRWFQFRQRRLAWHDLLGI
jgi:hypothetical protein